jgi:hypothetical protein
VARVTNLINKADALKQLNASLSKQKAEYDKKLKQYTTEKAVYDKEIVAYNKTVVAAAITHLKALDLKEDAFFRRNYRSDTVNVDFHINVAVKAPELDSHEPDKNQIDRIEKQIRSVSIMSGETFNASMLDSDFFNCL